LRIDVRSDSPAANASASRSRSRFAAIPICSCSTNRPRVSIESRVALWDQIRLLAKRGKSIIFTTHYLAEADALADRIALISRGAIVADGSPAEIKARAGTAHLEVAYLTLTKTNVLEAAS